jgi:hypothetical protein
MRLLISDKERADWEKEILGVLALQCERYFPEKLVRYVFEKKPLKQITTLPENPTVFICNDPASHQKSSAGFVGIVYGKGGGDNTDSYHGRGGDMFIIGMAEIRMERCEIMAYKQLVARFTEKVLNHSCFDNVKRSKITVVPIIECNNNDMQSLTCVEVIKDVAKTQRCKYFMPFNNKFFAKNISENIGVFTKDDNKRGGIEKLLNLMMDDHLHIATRCATLGAIHLRDYKTPTIKEVRETIVTEFLQVRDLEDGSISGKTPDNEDDLFMALLLGAYWSHCWMMMDMYNIVDN